MSQLELNRMLRYWCQNGNDEYAHNVQKLINYGADVNDPTGVKRVTPLMYAVQNDCDTIVKILLENGANVYDKDYKGCTPLMYACKSTQNVEIIKLLIAWKSDITDTDWQGKGIRDYLDYNEELYKKLCKDKSINIHEILSSATNNTHRKSSTASFFNTKKQMTVDEDTVKQVEQARKKLLDLTMRNSLLNFRHSERAANQVRIVNNNINEIYNNLLSGKDIELLPLPELPTEPRDEKTTKFQNAFEMALVTDTKYLAEKEELDKKDNIEEDEEEKIIRELKDRVREQLGLPPRNSIETTKKEWALDNGIDPSFENSFDNHDAQKYKKCSAQTLLYPKEFKSKMVGIRRIVRSDREEKGTNTFYIALGFLEWYEQSNSETKHLAPLLLLKLEDLKQDPSRRRIFFTSAGDSVSINISLREKLKDFQLNLPDFEEDDTPEYYLNKITKLITSYPKWKVRTYITVGRFIFSRLAMYEDLKIENWDTLLTNKSELLKSLFDTRISDGNVENIYDIDKDENVSKYAPILITGADSSQHSAIVDVMKNNDVVIKGPPGTGKSQTITNLIANALYANKRVLFMAEKKAALDVVFSRLKYAGLEDYCFELHSDKTNITHVRAGLEKSCSRYWNAHYHEQSQIPTSKIEKLISEKKELREYYDTLQTKVGKLGKTLFDVIWCAKELEHIVNSFPPSLRNIEIKDVSKIKLVDFENDNESIEKLEQLYNSYQGSLCGLDNSWKNITNCSIKVQNVQDFLNQIELIIEKIDSALDERKRCEYNNTIRIPNILDDANNLLKFIQQCKDFIENKQIGKDWLLNAEKGKIQDKLCQFAHELAEYNKLYSNLSKMFNNPVQAYNDKGKFSESYEKLCDDDIKNLTLRDFLALKDSISNEIKGWEESRTLQDIASLILKKQNLNVADICSVKHVIPIFSEIADILPHYLQNIDMFLPHNWSILDKVAKELSDLRQLRSELSDILEIDSALGLSDLETQLNKAIKSVTNAGFFSFFDKDYKEAKNLYKLIAIKPKAKKDIILSNFKSLLKFINKRKEFMENKMFSNVLGAYFQGDKTDIAEIQSIREFYRNIYNLENAYGNELVQQLKAYFTAKENFDSFPRISNLSSSLNNFDLCTIKSDNKATLEEHISNLKKKRQIIEVLTDEFVEQFTDDGITISSIVESNELFLQFNKLVSQISKLNAEIALYIPEITNGTDSDIEKIEHLLKFNELISTSTYISDIKGFMQDIAEGKLDDIKDIIEQHCQRMTFIYKQIENVTHIFVFGGQKYAEEGYKAEELNSLKEYFESILKNKDAIYNVCAFFDALNRTKGSRYENLINYLQEQHLALHNLSEIYSFLVYNNLAKECNEDKWNTYIPNEMNQITENIRHLEDEVYELNGKLLIQQLNKIQVPEGINSTKVNEKTNLQLILHQISGHSRSIPLRRFISRAGRAIQALKPCFLMSPIAVAQYIPPQSIDFDLLIVDEASQMYFEEALGGIFRAKQIVVVGDDKQLPPTPFFQKNSAQEDEFDEEEDNTEDLSILDTCISRGFEHRELLWHYRSKDSTLIEFSNANFYNDNLKIFPSPVVSSEVNGVQRVYVGGIYQSRQNEDEADAIIKEIKRFVRNYPDRSLGIATINSTQKALMDKKCDLLYEQDEKFREYRDKWDNGLESFFVKNLENVQGDERDYIFVSTVYGPESKGGRVLQRFGPINGKFGHRRLNVLFTRAKYGLKLFTSLKSEDIVVSEASTIGLRTFRDYLLYSETGRIAVGNPSNRGFDSDFEKMVYDLLTSKGYEVDIQVGVKGFFIDLAVKHPRNKAYYALGIECDGEPYHSTKSARDRDCIRQSVLESLGWKIYRIWSKDWFYNTQKEIEKLLAYIEDISKTAPTIEYAINKNYIDIHEEEENPRRIEQMEIDLSQLLNQSTVNAKDFTEENNAPDTSDVEEYATDDDKEDDENDLGYSQPIQSKVHQTKRVELFDTIKYIRLSDDSEHTIQITTQEGAPEKGLINQNAALAQALLDAEEGEEVEVNDKPILVKEIIKAEVNIKSKKMEENNILEDDIDDEPIDFSNEDEDEDEYEIKTDVQSVRKTPRKHTTFAMLHIPVGSELSFIKDKKIIAITTNEVNGIRLKDKPVKGTLSSVTQMLAVRFGYTSESYAGPRWWLYKGKTLASIREDMENSSIPVVNDKQKDINSKPVISNEYDQIVKMGSSMGGYFRQATYFYFLVDLNIERQDLSLKIRDIYEKYDMYLNRGVLSHELQTAEVCLKVKELLNIIDRGKQQKISSAKIIEQLASYMKEVRLNYHTLFENK